MKTIEINSENGFPFELFRRNAKNYTSGTIVPKDNLAYYVQDGGNTPVSKDKLKMITKMVVEVLEVE